MNARYSRLKARLRSRKATQPDTGQGLTEYAIILGLVALAVIAIINLMGPAISNVFANFVERAPVAPPDLVGYTRIPPTATATTNPNPTLTISTTGGGLGSIDLSPAGTPIGPGVYTFPAGTAVTLTANPDPSNYFNGWGDDLAGSTNPVEVLTMNADYVVSANFEQIKYTLTINITGNGDVTASPAKAAYDPNDVVILDAVPLSGASFITWGGDLSGNADPETLIMDGDKTVDAIFTVSCYDLAVSETPPGGGSIIVNTPPNCGSPATQYNHGTTVSLTANPAAGYAFNDWSGDASGTNATTSVQMDGPRTAVANFSLIQYTLTINIVDGGTVVGSNTVSISPNQPGYLLNDVVTLTANPDTGKQFVSWSGDLTGTANPGTVTMDADKVINANFGDTCYALTLGNVPGGGGTVNVSPSASAGCASGTYVLGEIVTLAAAPANGYEFTQWTGDISGTNSTALVTMDANKSITANYQQCYTLNLTVNPSPAGSIVVSPAPNCAGGATYSPGTGVSLTAVDNSGYTFSDWSGDITGATNPASVTMDNNRAVTANFATNVSILFIVDNPTSMNTSDQAIESRLQSSGYSVQTINDDNLNGTSDATGKQLVVISSTVNPNDIPTGYITLAVPILVWEENLFQPLDMASNDGSDSNERELDITDPTHPIPNGLPLGLVTVYTNNQNLQWGTPSASAKTIAIPDDDNLSRAMLFAYDTGDSMVGRTAPARRVGFFLDDDTARYLTATGWSLFDNAIDWAINGGSGNPFVTIRSDAGTDGDIRENGSTNTGGSVDSGGNAIEIGDDNNGSRRQYIGVVSFDTSVIPSGASIVSIELRLKRAGTGGNPYSLGDIHVDIAPAAGFSNNTALEAGDFEAPAAVVNAGTLSATSADDEWATVTLTAHAGSLNRGGYTQFRLYFTLPDNGNGTNDRIGFDSGNQSGGSGGYQPQLVIVYQ